MVSALTVTTKSTKTKTTTTTVVYVTLDFNSFSQSAVGNIAVAGFENASSLVLNEFLFPLFLLFGLLAARLDESEWINGRVERFG